jgi:hypothetical protein
LIHASARKCSYTDTFCPLWFSSNFLEAFKWFWKENFPKFLEWYTQVTQWCFEILTKAMNLALISILKLMWSSR